MEEYVCKNSPYQKAFSVRLYESYLEIDRSGAISAVKYERIQSVCLKRKRDRFAVLIQAGSEKITITNRFYLANGAYEDRSKKYTLFVRIFHLRLLNQNNIDYLLEPSWPASLFTFMKRKRYEANNFPLEYLPW